MRIGEIAVIGTHANERKKFIAALCAQLEMATPHFAFGRFPINDQLTLHLYGLAVRAEDQTPSLDLLTRRMLGYIVLFPWGDDSAFAQIKPCLDYLATRHEAAIVVAAHAPQAQLPPSPALVQEGMDVSSEGKLAFFEEDNPASAKRVLLSLIDLLLERADV